MLFYAYSGGIFMEHRILSVQPHGIAWRRGIRPGDTLLKMNGEEIIDHIDYQALSSRQKVDLMIRTQDGEEKNVRIIKAKDAPLGMVLADTACVSPRTCHNKCIFCFIDQMPPGMRETLYVKDDDWRFSLMMGNYVTLTNVDEPEFDRILRRKASPLYISVHATDAALRCRMMNNRFAGNILERLQRLKDAGLSFHCQVVLCPGWNDGAQLENTLTDLYALCPAAKSVALVPVGLTRFRDGLENVQPFTKETAEAVLQIAERFQEKALNELGTRFVFPSDELMLIAGRAIPQEEAYEGYPQIENGVGLVRKTEEALKMAAAENTRHAKPRSIVIPCGTSIAPVMAKWMEKYSPDGISVTVLPVKNTFFGETVTVTGLLTGGDLIRALKDRTEDEAILCGNTLREEGDLFLDDTPLEALRTSIPMKLTVAPNGGAELFQALLGLE